MILRQLNSINCFQEIVCNVFYDVNRQFYRERRKKNCRSANRNLLLPRNRFLKTNMKWFRICFLEILKNIISSLFFLSLFIYASLTFFCVHKFCTLCRFFSFNHHFYSFKRNIFFFPTADNMHSALCSPGTSNLNWRHSEMNGKDIFIVQSSKHTHTDFVRKRERTKMIRKRFENTSFGKCAAYA